SADSHRVFFPDFPSFHPKTSPAGKRLPPSVYLLPPPAEEISGPRPTLSLTCLARGFYPEDIDVQWQRDQEPVATSAGSDDPEAASASS
ncbi:IGHE protein, partial [Bombycilla garrulus]|nr:IGHE protein [Bombycilla garrulus]